MSRRQKEPGRGYVYCITANFFPPGWRKIGFTMNTPEERARSMTSDLKNLGAGFPRSNKKWKYKVEYALKIPGNRLFVKAIENYCHTQLELKPEICLGGEWFLLTPQEAENIIKNSFIEFNKLRDTLNVWIKLVWFSRIVRRRIYKGLETAVHIALPIYHVVTVVMWIGMLITAYRYY